MKITGELTPAVDEAIIALEFTNPNCETNRQTTAVGVTGKYELDYLPEDQGKWQVQAFWLGSDASTKAVLEPCYFEVRYYSPSFTLEHNNNYH